MKIKSHLQFYLENKISPVSQNFKKNIHFQRRSSLYKYLGLTKEYFENKSILEVGPAEGHNSTFLAHLNPKELLLLEPNPYAHNNIRKIFKKINVSDKRLKIVKTTLEKFKTKKVFDIVICEAWLGINSHERKLMKKLSKFVKKGGILIVTAASPIGFFSNILRRILGNLVTKNVNNLDKKTSILVKAFSSHLKTLKNMSCPHKDWVQDSLIGSGFLSMHPTPKMIFKDVGEKFDFFNSYPTFNSDWRWYKDLHGGKENAKKNFLKNYFKQCHNFIDYRHVYKEANPKLNSNLEKKVSALMQILIKYEYKRNDKNFNKFKNKLKSIYKLFKKIDSFKNEGVLQGINLIENKKNISVAKIKKMEKFRYVFGRELLYLSLLKIK